jgi:ParB-like chromosome segregation protein Spo0J
MAKSRIIETGYGASNAGDSSVERSAVIEIVPIKKLRRSRRTARYHSKTQIKQIAESIASFGFINPIVADTFNRVVAGFGRLAAAEILHFRAVPVIRVRDLSETEIRAYMLADNKLGEKAGWDRALLIVELEELEVALPEIGLDLSITGFEQNEIDTLFADFDDGSALAAEAGAMAWRL